MELNYKINNNGIGIDNFQECESFTVGDSIICMNDSSTMNITKNRKYEALYIYESWTGTKSSTLVQIADDGNEICSYETERFTSIQNHREQQLSKILDK